MTTMGDSVPAGAADARTEDRAGLIDVSDVAARVGFHASVAMSKSVWRRAVTGPEGPGVDELGRLWEVLWHASIAARRLGPHTRSVTFPVRSCRPGASVLPVEIMMGMNETGYQLVLWCADDAWTAGGRADRDICSDRE